MKVETAWLILLCVVRIYMSANSTGDATKNARILPVIEGKWPFVLSFVT